MQTNDCYYLGYISKTIGFEGSLLAFFEVSDPSLYKNLEAIHVLIDGKLVPFFVDEINVRKKDKEVVLDIEDIQTPEQARFLCNRKIFVHQKHLKHNIRQTGFQQESLVGFSVYDQNNNHLGIINEILEYPGNPVFSIKKGKQEVLLPVAEEFIKAVDSEKKEIIIAPPDGLLDLYI